MLLGHSQRRCGSIHRYRAIGIVGGIMARQRAGVRRSRVGNGRCLILPDDSDIEIHEPLAGDGGVDCTHAMRSVADRAREAVLRNVEAVLRPAGIGHDVIQIVAFRAHRVRPLRADIGRRKRVRDRATGRGGLAELIIPFQDVRVDRTVGPVWPGAAKFAVIVAGVAIGAEDLGAHEPRGHRTILIQHIRKQARLRQCAAAGMRHGMT